MMRAVVAALVVGSCSAFVGNAALAAAHRCVSNVFPADHVSLLLAGADNVKTLQSKILAIELNLGRATANNLRETLPLQHYWINTHIEKAFYQHNCTQLVLLGAGFDTRAYTMPALWNQTVFEVDSAEVMTAKEDLLSECLQAPIAGKIVRVPIDLARHGLLSTLTAHGLDLDQPTCFVMEGLLYHLEPNTATTLMRLPLNFRQSCILYDTITPGLAGLKSGSFGPGKELRRLGYKNIVVNQQGDDDANFGVLDTSVPHALSGHWGYKYNMRFSEFDGVKIQRFFLVKAEHCM